MMLLDIFHQALLFFPFLVGPFLSYGVSGIPDLTVEGSYVLAIVIFASLITLGVAPVLAGTIGLLGAALAGVAVGVLQTKGAITPLLAGVLMLFILQSCHLMILGKPHVSLLHLLSADRVCETLVLLGINLALLVLIARLLQSKFGVYLHGLRNHPNQLRRLGVHPDRLRIGVLTLSNLIVGLAGIMAAHCYGYASVQMGQGQAIVAIGLVVIAAEIAQLLKGERIRPGVIQALLALFVVNTAYFFLTALLFRYGLDPLYLKLCVGATFALLLSTKGRMSRRVRTSPLSAGPSLNARSVVSADALKKSAPEDTFLNRTATAAGRHTLLDCRHVMFRYAGATQPLLSDVNLSVAAGDFFFLRGENGAGKSTLLKLLQNDLQPTGGEIQRSDRLDVLTLSQRIDQFLCDDLTVYENCFLFYYRGRRSAPIAVHHHKLRELFDAELVRMHPKFAGFLDSSPRVLSGGMRQLLATAMVFLRPPQLLLLDEHTAALDAGRAQSIMQMTVQRCLEQRVAGLAITHQRFEAIPGTRELRLHQGHLMAESPQGHR